MRFELTTPTLARLCSTPELRPRSTTGRDHKGGMAPLVPGGRDITQTPPQCKP